MKIAVVKSKFLEALLTVQNIVAAKQPVQILMNVLIQADEGQLRLTTTDLDMVAHAKLPCEVEIPGATTLPIHPLSAIVKELDDGRIELETAENDRATIKSGTSHFSLLGLPARDYPVPPPAEDAYAFTLDQARFREMLRQTAYAVDPDTKRPNISGLLLSFRDGKLSLVATDTRRLALAETELDVPKEFERDLILPQKAFKELLRAPQLAAQKETTLKIIPTRNQAIFDLDTLILTTKLIDATYPNYRKVIPEASQETIPLDRNAILSALRRVTVVLAKGSTAEDLRNASFTFSANTLTILAESPEIGQARETLPVQYAGPEITILLNPDFILQAFSALTEDALTLDLSDPTRPVTIKNLRNFLYVVMPMRRTA